MSAHLRAGAVSGTECRRRSKGRGRRSEQRERGPFRALKMRPVRQVLLLARRASEDASGAAVGCPQLLWSRLFCGPLKMRRVPEKPVLCTEYLFRTVEACFEHRVPLKTPSVQKKGVFMHRMPFPYRRSLFFTPHASENASRTPVSLFEHGTHIPYHRRPSPVQNARQRQVAAAAAQAAMSQAR